MSTAADLPSISILSSMEDLPGYAPDYAYLAIHPGDAEGRAEFGWEPCGRLEGAGVYLLIVRKPTSDVGRRPQ